MHADQIRRQSAGLTSTIPLKVQRHTVFGQAKEMPQEESNLSVFDAPYLSSAKTLKLSPSIERQLFSLRKCAWARNLRAVLFLFVLWLDRFCVLPLRDEVTQPYCF
jgi:hypothetical protein